jgi:hypothetical protein
MILPRRARSQGSSRRQGRRGPTGPAGGKKKQGSFARSPDAPAVKREAEKDWGPMCLRQIGPGNPSAPFGKQGKTESRDVHQSRRH